MNIAKPLLTAIAAASLTTLAGCTGASGGEQIASTQQAEDIDNGLTLNGLTLNGLTLNGLTLNGLTLNGLTLNGLTLNGLTLNGLNTMLEDPQGRLTFSYVVSCALPPDESITLDVDGTDYTFDGELGLAPQWGKDHGFCDGMCQEWVSACLLARLDYDGVHREISVRGQAKGLAVSAAEAAAYPHREATYFGNVFTYPFPQQRFACLSPGQTEIPRVCGPSLQGCAVDVTTTCDKVCEGPTKDGAFTNCRPGNGREWYDLPYHGSITVYTP